nr:unnamed protein product [Spirometra erinaceieuropaei]
MVICIPQNNDSCAHGWKVSMTFLLSPILLPLPLLPSTSPAPPLVFPSISTLLLPQSPSSILYSLLSTGGRFYGEGDMQSHNPRSDRPETEDGASAWGLAHYKVGIAALSETRFSEQGQLEEMGSGYNFLWSGRPRAERRDAGVAFAIQSEIVGRLPCLLQGINDRLMSLPLRRFNFAILISAYA